MSRMSDRAAAIRHWPRGYMTRLSREWPQTDAFGAIAGTAGSFLREPTADHAVTHLRGRQAGPETRDPSVVSQLGDTHEAAGGRAEAADRSSVTLWSLDRARQVGLSQRRCGERPMVKHRREPLPPEGIV